MEVQTPQAQPPVKQLSELTLRVYGAEFEPKANVVRLHAEAKTVFADGTTGAGVLVGFFVNGRRLTDIALDDYGLALLDVSVSADSFREGENELVLRVMRAETSPMTPPQSWKRCSVRRYFS